MAYQGSSGWLVFLSFSFIDVVLLTKRYIHTPGWEKERDKIVTKCHKNTYNYCNDADAKKVGDCVKGMAGSLMVSRTLSPSKYESDTN